MPVHNKELIGTVTLDLLDQLDSDDGVVEGWEECTINDVIIVVDMESAHGHQGVFVQASDSRSWFQAALLQAGIDTITE